MRLKEAAKLGFEIAIIPQGSEVGDTKLKLIEIGHIKQLEEILNKQVEHSYD